MGPGSTCRPARLRARAGLGELEEGKWRVGEKRIGVLERESGVEERGSGGLRGR